MSPRKPTRHLLAVLALSAPLTAQVTTDSDLAPCGVPLAALPPCEAAGKPAPGTVAIVEGAVVTLADLDAELRRRIEALEDGVKEARRVALAAEIDAALLEAEAANRKSAPRDFYFTEVMKKLAPPTEADVKAEYESRPERWAKRPIQEQYGAIVSSILADRETARVTELASALRKKFPVEMKTDPGAFNVGPATVLATIAGKPFTYRSAATRIESAVWTLRFDVWRAESDAVEKLVRERLLAAEATRRGLTPQELVKKEVTDRLVPPTEDEILAYFKRFPATFGSDLAAAKEKVVERMKKEAKASREADFERELRAGRQVRLLFEEPQRPVLDVGGPLSPSRGGEKATVTIVEFGDFQCPPCGLMNPVVEELLRTYSDRIRYQFRHFPLGIHEFAQKAAMAAVAAQEQGRYWEFSGILFRNQKQLDAASLKRYAAEAGLDLEKFSRDLDSDRVAAIVVEDRRAGQRAGVTGTPAFFVNGVRQPNTVAALSLPGMRRTIDSALKATPAGGSAPR